MRLEEIATIQSGHISRAKIESNAGGAYHLLQAKDVEGLTLFYKTDSLTRFNTKPSRKDWVLEKHDIVFMTRGSRNYSILIDSAIPKPTLAAACFFIIRPVEKVALPQYLVWYLNQAPALEYLKRNSGQGVHMSVVNRATLENLDIPLPPMEQQRKIVAMDILMREEQALLAELAEKRKKMITETCLKSIRMINAHTQRKG